MSDLESALRKIVTSVSNASGLAGAGSGEADLRERVLKSVSARGKASVCVLFSGPSFAQAKVLLTERSQAVATHAGQVAFPGGLNELEDGGDPAITAFRECEEEVGISRAVPKALGILPPFPTMTGSFEVTPVVAVVSADVPALPFRFSEEVTAAEWVSIAELRRARKEETRSVSGIEIRAPYFMWGERKMWGLSAWIFDFILNRYDTIGE